MKKATVRRKLKKGVGSTLATNFIRFGYATRGFLYIVTGWFSFKVAVGLGGEPAGLGETILAFNQGLTGKTMLVVISVGLLGYALWGLIRAVLDFIDLRIEKIPFYSRLGYLISAAGYGFLLLPVFGLLKGDIPRNEDDLEKVAYLIFQIPQGGLVLTIVGVTILGIGIGQFYLAMFSSKLGIGVGFSEEIKKRQWFVYLARMGISGRGLVLTLIGAFLVDAGRLFDPKRTQDMGEVLHTVLLQPLGNIWLVVIAAGLVSFGVFSFLMSFWIKLPDKDND